MESNMSLIETVLMLPRVLQASCTIFYHVCLFITDVTGPSEDARPAGRAGAPSVTYRIDQSATDQRETLKGTVQVLDVTRAARKPSARFFSSTC